MIAAIFVIGLILIASGLKNTQHELGEQLQRDILGSQGFVAWAAAIIAIGCLGYIPGLRQSSRYLLLLIAVVMIVRNPGVFANVQTALQGASQLGPAPSVPSPLVGGSSNVASSTGPAQPSNDNGGGAGAIVGDIFKAGGLLAGFL